MNMVNPILMPLEIRHPKRTKKFRKITYESALELKLLPPVSRREYKPISRREYKPTFWDKLGDIFGVVHGLVTYEKEKTIESMNDDARKSHRRRWADENGLCSFWCDEDGNPVEPIPIKV